MKVYISGPRDHWISPYTILEKVMFWVKEEDFNYDDPVIERWSNRLEPICKAICWVADKLHPPIKYVKIDHYDSWSVDYTLALITLPLLKQLKETKHGAPNTDDQDVPEHLWSTQEPPEGMDIDGKHFERWDWILDEMIWAFEQKVDFDSDSKFFDHSECDPKALLTNQVSSVKCDWDGLKAHQQRLENGFRLFGKYYQALWD